LNVKFSHFVLDNIALVKQHLGILIASFELIQPDFFIRFYYYNLEVAL